MAVDSLSILVLSNPLAKLSGRIANAAGRFKPTIVSATCNHLHPVPPPRGVISLIDVFSFLLKLYGDPHIVAVRSKPFSTSNSSTVGPRPTNCETVRAGFYDMPGHRERGVFFLAWVSPPIYLAHYKFIASVNRLGGLSRLL